MRVRQSSGRQRITPKRPPSRLHRPSSRRPARSRHLSQPLRVVLLCVALLIALLTWAIAARAFAPKSNSSRSTFDAIIVLGTPADSDGNPTPELQDRITEAVREYERGVAPHLIVSGAAAHNHFVEAEVMARIAQAQGVPSSMIFQDARAMDTIQNACYSSQIMREHHWTSVEVISSASHLPRAAMIFGNLPGSRLEWRMHPAPDNLTPGYYSRGAELLEIIKTARYLIWSRWVERCS